jgi:hypothetical protein
LHAYRHVCIFKRIGFGFWLRWKNEFKYY